MSARRFAAIAVVVVSAVLSAQPAGIERARWLQGCWEASLPARTVEEIWTRPSGGSMMGISRTIRDGKLTEYELVVLREQGDRLAYVAHPSAQTPATFLSTTVTSTELVFENPAHDFPQQIGYRRDGDGLLAWISGSQNGKTRRAEFPYTRIKCDAWVDGRPIAQRPARYAVRRINAPAAFVTGRAERRNIGR